MRKPDDHIADNPVNCLRQFRTDHPRLDGTILLGVMVLLGIALISGMLARLAGIC